jgi:ABC-2 type transport system ATP-binding protein
MTQNEGIAEIANYLKHQDYSLAVRRMLDAALDTGSNHLIEETIKWSKDFRNHNNKQNATGDLPSSFFTNAENLLNRLGVNVADAPYNTTALINVNGISKTYTKGNFSLKPISLQINTGDILGVVGENGNGKTTLLRCLSGQLAIDKGVIEYKLLDRADYYNIKNHVAFIPQRIPRWYGFLRDNLHFSASITGVTGKQNELMVDFMLERLNLTDYAHLNWNQISSGYRTRFEIARILLQKPQLLILDEPLANLDINAQQTILTDLKFLAKSAYHPMGIILSSQQLHEVEKVADTVLFIKQGNCLFRTGDTNTTVTGYVLEIETTANREQLVDVLNDSSIQIQFNGGFYTITSATYQPADIVGKLVSSKIPVTYFRDITYSTKRYF